MKAQIRKPEDKAQVVRQRGMVPGVVYGHKFENLNLEINQRELEKILKEAGESSLLDLDVDGKKVGNVVISDYQLNPLSGEIVHFDLHKVRMNEKIVANVALELEGEAPAVKELGGTLVVVKDELEIRCLPGDLLAEIKVDISALKDLEDMIRVKDLKISDKVEILDEEEDVLVQVEAPRTEEEMAELETTVEENLEKVEGAVAEEPAAEVGEEKKK